MFSIWKGRFLNVRKRSFFFCRFVVDVFVVVVVRNGGRLEHLIAFVVGRQHRLLPQHVERPRRLLRVHQRVEKGRQLEQIWPNNSYGDNSKKIERIVFTFVKRSCFQSSLWSVFSPMSFFVIKIQVKKHVVVFISILMNIMGFRS